LPGGSRGLGDVYKRQDQGHGVSLGWLKKTIE
jgi:hypothetical protein